MTAATAGASGVAHAAPAPPVTRQAPASAASAAADVAPARIPDIRSPEVTSADFPRDAWGKAVGQRGRFEFRHRRPGRYADSFEWWVDGGPPTVVRARRHPKATTVTYRPTEAGAHTLYVRGITEDGQASHPASYPFKVRDR